MPSENAFKKQADVAADALKSFVAVQNLIATIYLLQVGVTPSSTPNDNDMQPNAESGCAGNYNTNLH